MHGRSLGGLVSALVAAALVAAPSAMAADRTANLSKDAKTFAWTGATKTASTFFYGFGAPFGPLDSCTAPGAYCDTTLVKLTGHGPLAINLTEGGDGLFDDFDLYVYRADAAGAQGALVGDGGQEGGGPESVTLGDASGNYLVVLVYFQAVAGAPSANLSFNPVLPPKLVGR